MTLQPLPDKYQPPRAERLPTLEDFLSHIHTIAKLSCGAPVAVPRASTLSAEQEAITEYRQQEAQDARIEAAQARQQAAVEDFEKFLGFENISRRARDNTLRRIEALR